MGISRVHPKLEELIEDIQDRRNVKISKTEATRVIAQKAKTQLLRERKKKKDEYGFDNLNREDII